MPLTVLVVLLRVVVLLALLPLLGLVGLASLVGLLSLVGAGLDANLGLLTNQHTMYVRMIDDSAYLSNWAGQSTRGGDAEEDGGDGLELHDD